MKPILCPMKHRELLLGATRLLACAVLLSGLQACSGGSWLSDPRGASASKIAEPPIIVTATPPEPRAEARPAAPEAVAEPPPAPQRAPAPHAPTPVAALPSSSPPPTTTSDMNRTASTAPEAPALLPLDTPLPKGRWAVRTGVFREKLNAYRQAAMLRDVIAAQPDLPAEQRVIRVLDHDGRFLVLLGDLAELPTARQLVARLQPIWPQKTIVHTP